MVLVSAKKKGKFLFLLLSDNFVIWTTGDPLNTWRGEAGFPGEGRGGPHMVSDGKHRQKQKKRNSGASFTPFS